MTKNQSILKKQEEITPIHETPEAEAFMRHVGKLLAKKYMRLMEESQNQEKGDNQ